ncbi:MAG: 6-carboxytetrahydropterin synthase QueD [Planctomycetes bacterium]|nr:6-carboxytetrahydropterin synthase QueD [Planctomycetota bacterium]
MDASTRPPASSSVEEDDPVCRRDPVTLVEVNHVPEAASEDLARCVDEARCRIYRDARGRADFVIAGYPEDFGRLRNLLVPLKSLDRVREALEENLADVAAPEGLPQLRSELYQKTEVAEEIDVPEGTTLLVSREFTFDAAHNLPRYNGKCERLHGHTYRLRITVKAPLDTWSGMAFDFHDLKKSVNERVVKILDHRYVNEVIANPSAEFMAIWAWGQLADLPLHEIQVWETPTSFVTYHGPPSN